MTACVARQSLVLFPQNQILKSMAQRLGRERGCGCHDLIKIIYRSFLVLSHFCCPIAFFQANRVHRVFFLHLGFEGIYLFIYLSIYLYANIYIYIYTYVYTHHIHIIYTSYTHHIHTCMQTYIHTSMHAYIHYITLHYITLHYNTLHYITLHYITLHYITYKHRDTHTHIHPSIHTYIHTSMHTCIHTYIHLLCVGLWVWSVQHMPQLQIHRSPQTRNCLNKWVVLNLGTCSLGFPGCSGWQMLNELLQKIAPNRLAAREI